MESSRPYWTSIQAETNAEKYAFSFGKEGIPFASSKDNSIFANSLSDTDNKFFLGYFLSNAVAQ